MSNRGSSFLVGIIIVLIVVVAVAGAFFFNVIPFPQGTTTTSSSTVTSQTTCSINGCVVALPIMFKITALYSSAPIHTVGSALTVLKSGSPATSYETGDTNSTGIWVTTKTYASDTSWFLYFNYGNVKYEFKFTVPRAQTVTDKTLPVHLIIANVGSYSITVLAPDGATIINPTTGNYNVTSGKCNDSTPCGQNAQPKFTVTITNSVDDSGFVSSFDRYELVENNQPRHLVANTLILTDTGVDGPPKITVSGWSRVVQGQKTSYYISLPDHAVDKHRLPDGTLDMNSRGQYQITMTFDTSQIAHGTSETINFQYIAYLDAYYYTNNGGFFNSEAIPLASFSFTLEA